MCALALFPPTKESEQAAANKNCERSARGVKKLSIAPALTWKHSRGRRLRELLRTGRRWHVHGPPDQHHHLGLEPLVQVVDSMQSMDGLDDPVVQHLREPQSVAAQLERQALLHGNLEHEPAAADGAQGVRNVVT